MRILHFLIVAAALPLSSAWGLTTIASHPRARLLMTVDKQMSSDDLVTYADCNEDFRKLMAAALKRIDTNRVLQGKPKYETVDGMIDAYVDEAASAGLGWTREDAESEVVRYLKRQAMADEGGEKAPDNVFIGIFALIVVYSAVTGYAPLQELPAAVVSPY